MALIRTEALQPLSRQHHQGLLVSLLLKKGLDKNASIKMMRDFVLKFWLDELHQHFHTEELTLVPFSKKHPKLVPALQQMLAEHQSMLLLVNRINNDATADLFEPIESFAIELDNHIRFEERELFQELQETLSADELASLKHLLVDVPVYDFCLKYPDKFWD